MSILRTIVRNRRYLPGYIRKYTGHIFRRMKYSLRKRLHVNAYTCAEAALSYRMGIPHREMGAYVKRHTICSLIHPDDACVRAQMKSDAAFMRVLRETADKALNHELLILNRYIINAFDDANGHYRWNVDFATSTCYTLTHYTRARSHNMKSGVDIKNLWELSRMQYLFAPALTYWLTGEERYAGFVRDTLLDWIDGNAWEEGPNWQPSMESGIRVANMMLAFQLILRSEAADDAFCARMFACAYLHRRFIMQNEENIGGRTSNHYLGALTGLACIDSTFPFMPGGKKNAQYVNSSFTREIDKQILPDGSGFEGSTQYQQLIGEMFCIARITQMNTGNAVDPALDAGLARAAAFSVHMRKPDGTWEQIGDNDGGHVFRLIPTCSPDGSAFVSLTQLLLTGNVPILDYPREIMLFGGCPHENRAEPILPKGPCLFADAHIACYRNEAVFVTLSAVDAHVYEMGGHTHNDKLSMTFCCDGKAFIIDPGSGTYTGDVMLRNRMRSTALHSTVQVGKRLQNAVPSNGALFALSHDTRILSMEVAQNAGLTDITGGVRWQKREDWYEHHRIVCIDERACEIMVKDTITLQSPAETAISRFVLHPAVVVHIEGNLARLKHGNVTVALKSPMSIRVVDGIYSRDYGQWEATQILEIPFALQSHEGELTCTICYGI